MEEGKMRGNRTWKSSRGPLPCISLYFKKKQLSNLNVIKFLDQIPHLLEIQGERYSNSKGRTVNRQ